MQRGVTPSLKKTVVADSILVMFGRSHRRCLCAVIAAGAVFFLSAGCCAIAFGQNPSGKNESGRAHIEEALRGLNRGREMGQVAISPDGKRLAWIEGGRGGGEIRVASPDDLSKSQRISWPGNQIPRHWLSSRVVVIRRDGRRTSIFRDWMEVRQSG